MNGIQLNADDDRTAMLRALENRKRLIREQEEREVAERRVRLVAADITRLQRIEWQHSHQGSRCQNVLDKLPQNTSNRRGRPIAVS